jgi:hypothetical protein
VLECLKNIDLGLDGKEYTLQQFIEDFEEFKREIKNEIKQIKLLHNSALTNSNNYNLSLIKNLEEQLNVANQAILELNRKIEEEGEIL